MRGLLLLLIVAMSALQLSFVAPQAAAAAASHCQFCQIGVEAGPTDGTVEGRATQDVPGSASPGGESSSGSCVGCRYLWLLACPGNQVMADGQGGFADPIDDPCEQIGSDCPPGELLERLYILVPPADIETGSTECVGGDPAPTVAQVGQAAADAFSQLLSVAAPTHQPDPIAIVNIPTLFATNIPPVQTFAETLLGQQVSITVTASWVWDFGDGATLTTSNPGGAYPNTSLNHNYEQAGKYTVRVTTNWSGVYSIDGGPPQPISGGVVSRPSPPFVVDVHEAHAVLVDN